MRASGADDKVKIVPPIVFSLEEALEYIKADAELDETGVDRMASVLLRFRNGVRASFNVGMALGVDTSDRYDRLFIHGSKGHIRSDVEYSRPETDMVVSSPEKTNAPIS